MKSAVERVISHAILADIRKLANGNKKEEERLIKVWTEVQQLIKPQPEIFKRASDDTQTSSK